LDFSKNILPDFLHDVGSRYFTKTKITPTNGVCVEISATTLIFKPFNCMLDKGG